MHKSEVKTSKDGWHMLATSFKGIINNNIKAHIK